MSVDAEPPVDDSTPDRPDIETVDIAIDIDTLLGETAAFEDHLEAESHIAVRSQPFAGRRHVLDHAVETLDATRISLRPAANPERVRDLIDTGPLVIENCQHLFRREIGGFDALQSVISAIASADNPVVTGWNSYAYSYLDSVQNIGETFETVPLSALSGGDLAEYIHAEAESIPTFKVDELEAKILTASPVPLGWRGIEFPIPSLDTAALKTKVFPPRNAESVVFGYLSAITHGNPGVALTLWEQREAEPTLRPSDLELPSVDLEHNDAFILHLILSQESVDRGLLDQWSNPDRVDQLLGSLERSGIIADHGGTVSIRPRGVPAAIEMTNEHRIL